MPRRPIDVFWREQIRSITANSRKLGPGPLRHQLVALAAEVNRTDVPSTRTVGRIQAEFRNAPEAERREYQEFRWPEAMERHDLPWEATAVALEGLRAIYHGTLDLGPLLKPGRRPSIAMIRWLWRVTLAADPDESLDVRMLWALLLSQSTGALPDARLYIEEMIVAGFSHEGELFFGESVDRAAAFRIVKAVTETRAREDVQELVDQIAAIKEATWESEPTEKAASTSGKTGAGARRSRSKKRGASTSSGGPERKSRKS